MDRIKVLVTGGAGYIGTHTVVELVQAGFDPVVVDNLSRSSKDLLDGVHQIIGKQVPFYNVDCNNVGDMRRVFAEHKDIASVIHFAAYKSVSESVTSPRMYYENNIGSLLTLLQVMKEFSVYKIVFSSSCTVYGQPDIIPVTESTPFKHAESAYGATKQMCERILEDEVLSWPALKSICLRYFNPIGAHPSGLIGELPIGIPNNLVPYITQTASGKRDKLTIFGADYDTPDGSCLRDFIHIVDLAQAHVAAIHAIDRLSSRSEAVNIGSGVPVSVLELVKAFIRITDVKLNYAIGPRRPGDIEKVYADPSKASQLFGWKTKLTIDEGLRDAWNWEKKLQRA